MASRGAPARDGDDADQRLVPRPRPLPPSSVAGGVGRARSRRRPRDRALDARRGDGDERLLLRRRCLDREWRAAASVVVVVRTGARASGASAGSSHAGRRAQDGRIIAKK